MSNSPRGSRPHAAYIEDYNEEAQDAIPGTKQSANVAAKRSKPEILKMKRNEASNSAESSRAVAAGGSPSQGSKKVPGPTKNGLLRVARKVADAAMRQNSKDSPPAPKPAPKRGVSRTQKKENLRLEISESRADAARMRLSGAPRESPTDRPHIRQLHPKIHGPPSPHTMRTPVSGPTPSMPISHPTLISSRPYNTISHGQRPASYHGGPMWDVSYTHTPALLPDHRTQPPPMPPNGYPPQSYPPPSVVYMPTPLPTSPNRQITYTFPPTVPPAYEHAYIPPPTHRWHSDLYHQQPPPHPPPRPQSMHSSGSIGDYPPIPLGYHAVPNHLLGDQSVRRTSVHQFEPPPVFQLDDEPHLHEDSEAYYRKLMPPPPVPQRPSIRKAATTATTSVPRRSKRDSLELTTQTSRKQSLDEARPPSRPSLSSRSSGSKNQMILPDALSSLTASRRRQRPVSYHGVPDAEKRAEEYQAVTAGHAPRQYLTTEDILKAKGRRSTKTHKSGGGSDAGSRASSGRGSNGIKRITSQEKHKANGGGDEGFSVRFPAGQGLKVDLRGEEPRTISLRQSLEGDGGMELNIKPHVRSRDGGSVRDKEEKIMERRHSTTGRKDTRQIKESEERDGLKRIRSRTRAVGEEKAPIRAVDPDNDLVERFMRLKTDGRSRRSSSRGLMRPAITPTLEGQMI